MFELSVAIKYLTPRWRQLSVSIISLISILVIALVVWLVVVFFSVTNGLTNSWIDKMIALTAPVRITPTEDYYRSYYYNIDSISSNSDYQQKTLTEKLNSEVTDPYDAAVDEELSPEWQAPDLDKKGILKDPVKLAFSTIQHLDKKFQHPNGSVYEIGGGQLRLFLDKGGRSVIDQSIFLGSYDSHNTLLNDSVLPITQAGIANLHRSAFRAHDDTLTANSDEKSLDFSKAANLQIARLKNDLLYLPNEIFTEAATFQALGLYKDSLLIKILIPSETASSDLIASHSIGFRAEKGQLKISANAKFFPEGIEIDPRVPTYAIYHEQLVVIPVHEQFEIHFTLQNTPISRVVPLSSLTAVHYEAVPDSPLWFDHGLPLPSSYGEPILLPKSYRDAGVVVGDQGSIGYFIATASAIQEQRSPVYVAGFYDPGIIPSGGKFIIARPDLVTEVRSAQGSEDSRIPSTGINVHLVERDQADEVKAALVAAFEKKGISRYWKIETYKEYEFAKDLIMQLGSEKRLFTLLATIIIIVACSNIISMLIILVNDKKKEIGILRSMGATSLSITVIFGTCGIVMGVMGSIVGTLAALFTLNNLQGLIDLISWVQGYEMFNPVFYGETLPSEISLEAFMFVVGVTGVISLLAGIIPAVKACLLKPSSTLRAE